MENKKVVKNASWIIGVQILRSLISIVISMLTARFLGPSNYGLINYAASIVSFVTPIMYLGLTGILVQEIINNPDDEGKTTGTAIALGFTSSLFDNPVKTSKPFLLPQSNATPNKTNLSSDIPCFFLKSLAVGLNTAKSIPLFITLTSYPPKKDCFTRFDSHSDGVTIVKSLTPVNHFFFSLYIFLELSNKDAGYSLYLSHL